MTKEDIELIAKFKPLALKRCDIKEDAEDLMQNVYIKILNNLPKFESMSESGKHNYVVVCIKNMHLDLLKYKKVGYRGFRYEISEINEPSQKPVVYSKMELKELNRDVKKNISTECFSLFIEGYSIKELMVIYNVEQDTILSRNFRGRKTFLKQAS